VISAGSVLILSIPLEIRAIRRLGVTGPTVTIDDATTERALEKRRGGIVLVLLQVLPLLLVAVPATAGALAVRDITRTLGGLPRD